MSDDYTALMKPWHHWQEGEKLRPVLALKRRVSKPDQPAGSEDEVSRAFNAALAVLRRDLIARVLAQSPAFFEQLIVDLLLAMGYGGRRRDLARRLGQSGDGGVDGVVEQDELGLDLIYVQAKRYGPSVPVPVSDVRDFVGALEAHHARKGVMVTTSHFTKPARQVVERVPHQISLLDQTRLADLMIRYNIGVTVRQSYQFKAIEPSYFISTGDSESKQPKTSSMRRLLSWL